VKSPRSEGDLNRRGVRRSLAQHSAVPGGISKKKRGVGRDQKPVPR